VALDGHDDWPRDAGLGGAGGVAEMNDYGRQFGGAFEAMAHLAAIGVVAMLVLGVIALVGTIASLWWAWNHLSVVMS
jgi:hypothetical protein